MSNLPNCPICSLPASWSEVSEPEGITVFFCDNCMEHFTREDTKTTLLKRKDFSSMIIDEKFLKSYFEHHSKK